MHDIFGVLEGHWPTCFVSVTYSYYHFRWSFIPTTWNHPFFPDAIRGEDYVLLG
jgi:hypothetical protein